MFRLWIMLCGVATSSALTINFTGDWKQNIGWVLECSWSFSQMDELQSVRLSRNGAQFKIYRPELYGPQLTEEFTTQDSFMLLNCKEKDKRNGACEVTIELYKPITENAVYTCEVSGERPRFIMGYKEYELEPYVPSTDVHIDARIDLDQHGDKHVTGPILLNCTGTGLPAPELKWTVGEQKEQGYFTGKFWNSTTKLYHVWSSLSLTPKHDPVLVTCLPEQRVPGKGLAIGPPAEYMLDTRFNHARRVFGTSLVTLVLTALTVVR